MNILIACEESQIVLSEFLKLGHNVFSCDLYNFSGNFPNRHIKSDVLPLLNGNCSFITLDGILHSINGKWDMIIAFPPLVPTNLFVSPNSGYTLIENKKYSYTESCAHTSIQRSKTFVSIARAMARCWG